MFPGGFFTFSRRCCRMKLAVRWVSVIFLIPQIVASFQNENLVLFISPSPNLHPIGTSHNLPNLGICATWYPNATTIVNRTFIGKGLGGISVNTQNTVYATNREDGSILTWTNGSSQSTRIISQDLLNPWNLFVAMNGDLYVNDGDMGDQITIFNTSMQMRELSVRFKGPCTGLFVDINNTIYCSSASHHFVVKVHPQSQPLQTVMIAGTGCAGIIMNMLNYPHGIFVYRNMFLYVADTFNDRIQVFDLHQKSSTTAMGFHGLTHVVLQKPTGIVLDANDNLFVVDSGSHRIIRSTGDGIQCVVGCSGQKGSEPVHLDNPQTMVFDSEGNMFVTDFNNDRIQKFILSNNSCGSLVVKYNYINLTYFSALSSYGPSFGRRQDSSLYYYKAFRIIVLKNSSYKIRSDSAIDTYGYLYRDQFNPKDVTQNLIQSNDDSGSNYQFQFDIPLHTNTYILVATTFSPYNAGLFSITVTGPRVFIFAEQ